MARNLHSACVHNYVISLAANGEITAGCFTLYACCARSAAVSWSRGKQRGKGSASISPRASRSTGECLLVGRRRIGQDGCSMVKGLYRQSGRGHINCSWSGAVSLPVLRWYHAASSQSPPIVGLALYSYSKYRSVCTVSITGKRRSCDRARAAGRNSCSTARPSRRKCLFACDLSLNRLHRFHT